MTGPQTCSRSGTCCLALLSLLGSKVSFPGSTEYNSSLSSYFPQQEAQVLPQCIVSPNSAADVSAVVRTLTSTAALLGSSKEKAGCRLAVRSGGHMAVAGAANIDGGVTIDLQSLNGIDVSSDRATVAVGPGAKWGEVYAKLDPLGLSVAGGRAAQVGVGGLTTGGGISYFSPRYGWTCDTVREFEAVLADGSIVNANARDNGDLFTALCGGSGNFGVVTRVQLETFEQGAIWGGSVYHATSTIDDQLKAFTTVNSVDNYDKYASLITSFGFASGQGSAVVNSIVYTKAVENPPVFAGLMKIPSLLNTMRLDSMTNISLEQGSFSPNGKRQLSCVITHESTLPMLEAAYKQWNKSVSRVENLTDINWSLSLEPLPPAIYKRAKRPNSLGLSNRSGALVITLLSASWTNAADDAKVQKAAHDLFDGMEKDARALGVYDPFVYLNYAAPWQDPIASYGRDSVMKLREVQNKVDPNRVFTHMVPGGFKIPDEQECQRAP